MTSQLGSVVDEFLAAQSPVRKAFVTAHLEGLIQIQDRCSVVACAPLRAALKRHSNDVGTSIQKLEATGGSFDQSLLASVKKILV
jgi:hypothetical protein